MNVESSKPSGVESADGCSEMVQLVKRITGDHMVIEPDTIEDTAHLANDLHCDSLDVVEIRMRLEEELGVDLPEDDEPVLVVIEIARALVGLTSA